MAAVKVSIGTSSGSLTVLDKALVNERFSISRQEQTKNKVTYHGNRNVAVMGQRKKVYVAKFVNIPSALYLIFASYALTTRQWWVNIPGHTGYNIFDGWAYVQFNNEGIERVTDTETYYAFELLIFEL